MKKVLSKMFSVFFIVFILLSFVIIGSFVYQEKKHPDQVPEIFGYSPLTVLSNSMNPDFFAGDMVLIKHGNAKDIKVGDVITFKNSENKYITHRVTEVSKNNGAIHFVTKGDNNNIADEEVVTSSNVVGKLVTVIPKFGNVTKFVTGPFGFFLLILLPLMGYVCLEVYTRITKTTKPNFKG